jgi:hypothetical protein
MNTTDVHYYSLLGALLLAGVKPEIVLDSAMDLLRQLRAFIRHPNLRGLSIMSLIEQKLDLLLPKNAHVLCSGRLGISLTKLWSFENRFVSEFDSRQDLIDAVVAGCFIPGWSGSLTAPLYKGEQFVDGAYSDNSPKFCDNNGTQLNNGTRSIQVCAFASDLDVAPRDKTFLFKARAFGNSYPFNLNNLIRSFHAMMPASIETYQYYLIEGHRNMKDYLFDNDFIKCRDCWHKSNLNETVTEKLACIACLKLMEQVDGLKIPKQMLDIFKD